MTWKKALTDAQERALVVDYEDGFKVVQLVDRYSISESTVYRILADYRAPRKDGSRKKRKPLRAQAKGRQLKPCGTNAAYQRHRRKGEICLPCIDAHARDQKEWSDGRQDTP